MSIAIVTDSTATLPPGVARSLSIRVVPLHVIIGAKTYVEGHDLDTKRVASALADGQSVNTSRPTPQEFADAYLRCASAGADEVVSIHLSGDMSGTYESAQMAAREASIPVHTVDSRLIGMGTGYAVISAAEAAAEGAGADDVVALATKRAGRTRVLFYVDTLEYLRRGGRIGAAAALLGSALAVKPLLQIDNGRIAPLEKVRTSGKALARLVELAVSAAGEDHVDVAVAHLANPDSAERLANGVRQRMPHLRALPIGEVGAVIGAHVGPGMVSVVVAPRI
jgi:DegV family protein with EDD domain